MPEDVSSDIQEILNLNQEANFRNVENEDDFKKTKQNSWAKHSEQYTNLLEIYVDNSKKNLESKQSQKWWFFGASISILAIAIISSVCIIRNILTGDAQTSSKIIETIPALLTFLTPLYVFPRLIADNLFNHKDEEDMIEILKQIIEHDNHAVK